MIRASAAIGKAQQIRLTDATHINSLCIPFNIFFFISSLLGKKDSLLDAMRDDTPSLYVEKKRTSELSSFIGQKNSADMESPPK
jgi:hypothetical protein